MTLKVNEIVFLYQTISNLAQDSRLNDAPIDVKFSLVRNAREIAAIAEDFDATRHEIMMNNSTSVETKVEGESNRTCTKEQLDYINEEIEKMGNVEVEVALIPIKLAQLEPLHLTMIEINGLYPIIKNEEA